MGFHVIIDLGEAGILKVLLAEGTFEVPLVKMGDVFVVGFEVMIFILGLAEDAWELFVVIPITSTEAIEDHSRWSERT